MQAQLQRILELQDQYSSTATEAMQERGRLIRGDVPAWINQHGVVLSSAMSGDDFFAQGRDGTGRKTRVPWARFCSRSRSPRATEGFYAVYLVDAKGEAVFLSLNQGTTDFLGGNFVPKPPGVIAERVLWARTALSQWITSHEDLVGSIELHDPGLGAGYEDGNIAAIRYPRDAIPPDEQLLDAAVVMADGLGRLYAASAQEPIPHEHPELNEAEEAAERASGRDLPARAGFRTNSKEIKAIENHAVAAARAYYEANGWTVKELGKPFDLEVEQEGQVLTVEVKGTTSPDGLGVPLTSGEVRHHEHAFPDNALVVVRGITLDHDGPSPVASGGRFYELRGWQISPDSLRPISYAYEVPAEIYQHAGVPADELLPAAD
jgi:hypothetical protein